jgi:hypothetical protein
MDRSLVAAEWMFKGGWVLAPFRLLRAAGSGQKGAVTCAPACNSRSCSGHGTCISNAV